MGGYLVVSWGVLQVTDTVASLLGFPLWFGTRAATEALRVHLSQSPTVHLASAAKVRDALQRMVAAPDAAAGHPDRA